jgi:enoyl-CoA hydratase
MNAEPILIELRGNVLWLILNRPESFNALTPRMVALMDEALARAESSHDLRALVVIGRGSAFCAGADLKAVVEPEGMAGRQRDAAAALKSFLQAAGAVFTRLERLPLPTVAALNGVTLAGGLEVALCCDMIVADAKARIGEGHAKYAQLPGGGGSVRLPRRVGEARTKYLMFSGELLTAAQARDIGLVDQVAGADGVEAAVRELVQRFEDKSPIGLRRMKALVTQGARQPVDTALQAEIDMCELHTHSQDRNEGLAAFAEKRTPCYTGR